ncbi:MAG: Asp-tRNA(Asn)/Glu-tRNA(Gln) amidotransferase subunit GatB [Candidatus Paceibacterota bacterium]
MTYTSTIGLEIHAHLKTRTKMFCGCINDFNEKHPNINVCPICLGHPGTMPVINKKAIEAVLKLGMVLNAEIPETSKFDRKNYFYPDLPKGYQISQYDKPLVIGGELNGVKITRIHLEEDAARLVHQTKNLKLPPKADPPQAEKTKGYSLVDFNRAGVPLMELVTEPVIKSGKEAVDFAKELQLILRYLEISDADMEKGQLRIEANISLQPEIPNPKSQIPNKSQIQNSKLGTKVEIKNLNSFRAVQDAINYEIKRQTEVLDKGEQVIHETRGWDENKKSTVSQRSKEEAHDYRYFPEPDLPPLDFNESNAINLRKLRTEIPELPADKRKRFIEEYRLSSEQAEELVSEPTIAQYFEESVSELDADLRGLDADQRGQKDNEKKAEAMMLLFNYLTSDVRGLANEKGVSVKEINITPENFADLIILIFNKEITSRLAKDILKEMSLTGLDPRRIIQEKGLSQVSDEETIKKTIQEIINTNQKAVEDYKKGKENALQFLFGQAMGKLKGQANPDVLRNLLQEELRE